MSIERREAIAALLARRPDDLMIVTGLGSTTWDLASLGDDERNFYLWGAMGGAAMIGLGIALAQPDRRVAVITGDGEMLMGLGSFATIGMKRPPNLGVIVFDNGRYGETGMQESHTARSADLLGAARACGIRNTFDVGDRASLEKLAAHLPEFGETFVARLRIEASDPPRILPIRDGVALKSRFRRAAGLG